MKRQKIVAGLLAICVPLVALGAERTVDVNGQLTGATEVWANGALWDVVFDDGAWEFSPGEDLPAKSKSQADAFGQALLDQVFIDEVRGTFDSDPELTNGCENLNACIIFTPYFVDSTSTYFSLTFNQRAGGTQDDFVRDIEGVLGLTGNFSDATTRVLARWTPSSNEPTNAPPTANAGDDQSARAGVTVELDGTASFDDNTATAQLVPSWTIVSAPLGSTTTLVNANTLTPSLFIDESGTYEVALRVTDAGGLESVPDTVVLSADNIAPTADAGPDQLTYLNAIVVLDGSGSSDPEGDSITYDWLVTSPSGVELQLTGAQPSLTVDEEGDYSAELTVSDFLGPGTADTAVVMVSAPDDIAQSAVLSAYDIVSALDVADVTTKGNKIALSNFFVQAVRSIQKGNIADAIEKLESALSRTDGCSERGAPDQHKSANERDWIVNCSAQVATYSEISGALAALRSL